MHFFTAAAVAALQMTCSLAAAKSLLSIPYTPRTETDLSLSASAMIRRALSDLPSDGLVPSKAMINATDEACLQRLQSLNGVAGSPTGMSVCYDVSELDQNTGEFQSQIYLWQVSAATGNWTNIDPTSLNVNIAFAGANLTNSAQMKRSSQLYTRSRLQGRTTDAVLITSESFSGRVIKGWDSNDEAKQMISLQPIVTVTAKTTTQFPITDTLSPTEAAFVMGVFQAPAAAAASAKANFVPPFVLPGTTISPQIFPIGMIVTGIWMVLFVTVVGLGTLGRLQFRHAYRRKARLNAWQAGSGPVPKAAVGYEKR